MNVRVKGSIKIYIKGSRSRRLRKERDMGSIIVIIVHKIINIIVWVKKLTEISKKMLKYVIINR